MLPGLVSTAAVSETVAQVVCLLVLLLQLRLDDSKLLPAVTPGILLPDGIPGLVQQVLDWPGMSALLGWVSGGHFLGGLGPHDLGKALLDVQVHPEGSDGSLGCW